MSHRLFHTRFLTIEALHNSLTKLTTEVKVNVVHAAVGGITDSDALLACTPGQRCRP